MKKEILDAVLLILNRINEERDQGAKFEVGESTILVGSESVLDSLELVSLVVEAEQTLTELMGRDVSLTDDVAMSQMTPPFQTPEAICEYVIKSRE